MDNGLAFTLLASKQWHTSVAPLASSAGGNPQVKTQMTNMSKSGRLATLGQRLLLFVGLVLAAVAALPIDCPLARWSAEGNCPGFLRDLLDSCEPFGRGFAPILVVLIIHQLDPARRWALPRVLACSLLSGLAADGIKILIVRTRPRSFDYVGDVWTTFGSWFPLTSAGSAGQSFPSGHTAVAVGLAMALIWLYPQGRRLFVALAVLVACQRVESSAHFLSDVLFGGAVGYLVANACLRAGWPSGWFDRWEQGWQAAAVSRRDCKSTAR